MDQRVQRKLDGTSSEDSDSDDESLASTQSSTTTFYSSSVDSNLSVLFRPRRSQMPRRRVTAGAGETPTAGEGAGGTDAEGGQASKTKSKAAGEPKPEDDGGGDNQPQVFEMPPDSDLSAALDKADDAFRQKTQMFQVRVRIIEAYQLEGHNISPVCRITIDGKTHSTCVRPGTNNPVWKYSQAFPIKCTLEDLWQKQAAFKIFSANKVRADSVVGVHYCDLGMIYQMKEHSLINKWLVLTLGETEGDVMGYLKVWMTIVRPGVVPPAYVPTEGDTQAIVDEAIWPSTVVLSPLTMRVKIYAIDNMAIPPKTGFFQRARRLFGAKKQSFVQKDKVTPFFNVEVGGYKITTKKVNDLVQQLGYGFDEELRFPVKWPTVFRSITFKLFHKNASTPHGFIELPFDGISRRGFHGFLPHFGPCSLAVYGGLDELKESERKKANSGKIDATAFQGRIILEVKCDPQPDELSKLEVADIPPPQVLAALDSIRPCPHMLLCSFSHATFLSHFRGRSIYFQVTLGHNGDTWRVGDDDTPNGVLCRTEARRPNLDHERCWFTWGNQKPTTLMLLDLDHQPWRVESANYFGNLAARVEAMIEQAVFLCGTKEEYLAQHITAMVDVITNTLTNYVVDYPDLPSQVKTSELDMCFIGHRKSLCGEIMVQVLSLKEDRKTAITVIDEMRDIVRRLWHLSLDPQVTGYPDIFIWMVEGIAKEKERKRIAYARVPAGSIFYAPNALCRGPQCGVPMSLTWRPVETTQYSEETLLGHVQVQMILTLPVFFKRCLFELYGVRDLTYYSELYENSTASGGGTWLTTEFCKPFAGGGGNPKSALQSLRRPRYFQYIPYATPTVQHPIHPALKPIVAKADDFFYEIHPRQQGFWSERGRTFQRITGEHLENQIPNYRQNYHIRRTEDCDKDGWQYSSTLDFKRCDKEEQFYHKFRRRFLIRKVVSNKILAETEVSDEHGGFMYGNKKSMSDVINVHLGRKQAKYRRRIWRYRMRIDETDFDWEPHLAEEVTYDGIEKCTEPFADLKLDYHKAFLTHDDQHYWHLRAYIYLGKDLLPVGRAVMPSPTVEVGFMGCHRKTHMLKGRVHPAWNRTLMFDNVCLGGNPMWLKKNGPEVLVQVWDATGKKAALMGWFFARPEVRPESDNSQIPTKPAKLGWHTVQVRGDKRGEVLATFELYQRSLPYLVPHEPEHRVDFQGNVGKDPDGSAWYSIPASILPKYREVRLEITCLGLRNMHRFQATSINCPFMLLQAEVVRDPFDNMGAPATWKHAAFEGNTHSVVLGTIDNMKANPNFSKDESRKVLILRVPQELHYMTPMTLCLMDRRSFGRKPFVGVCSVTDIESCRVQTLDEELEMGSKENFKYPNYLLKRELDEKLTELATKSKYEGLLRTIRRVDPDADFSGFTWWSRYNASRLVMRGKEEEFDSDPYYRSGQPLLMIYDREMEVHGKNDGFSDYCKTFKLEKTKLAKRFAQGDERPIGELKADIKIYDQIDKEHRVKIDLLAKRRRHMFNTQKCLVRVYVIEAQGLVSQNRRGTADPYIEIVCGRQRENRRDNFVAKTLDPVFGQMIEMTVDIPFETDLVIKVKDKNHIISDDDIGETHIDLENRLYSYLRPGCGIPLQYSRSGPCKWRDQLTPLQILDEAMSTKLETMEMSKIVKHDADHYQWDYLEDALVDMDELESEMEITSEKKAELFGPGEDRLALYILHGCFGLIPEHVETRSLHSSQAHGIEQGKLMLWVDVFPLHGRKKPPPPVNIAPCNPETMQLRICVFSVRHAVRPKRKWGVMSADLYVKAFVQGYFDNAQSTDVHYNVLDGEAEFNWRLIFNFDYLESEAKVMAKRKDKWWQLSKTVEKVAPKLVIQIFDNNRLGKDTVIGECEFDLLNMEPPELDFEMMDNVTDPGLAIHQKVQKSCTLACSFCYDYDIPQPPKLHKKTDKPRISMFKTTRHRGWWPLLRKLPEDDRMECTAKVDMEYQLVPKAEADEAPVGKARSKPNEDPILLKPDRGVEGWWLPSKMKMMCRFVGRKHKFTMCLCLLLILIVLMIFVLVLRWPEVLSMVMSIPGKALTI